MARSRSSGALATSESLSPSSVTLTLIVTLKQGAGMDTRSMGTTSSAGKTILFNAPWTLAALEMSAKN